MADLGNPLSLRGNFAAAAAAIGEKGIARDGV